MTLYLSNNVFNEVHVFEKPTKNSALFDAGIRYVATRAVTHMHTHRTTTIPLVHMPRVKNFRLYSIAYLIGYWGVMTSIVVVPPPTVTVGSREDGDGLCSKTNSLNYAINQTYYGIDTEPVFSWLAPDGSAVSSEEGTNPHVDVQNRQLIFSDITTVRSGVYMCQISVASNNMARTSVYINSNGKGMKCLC